MKEVKHVDVVLEEVETEENVVAIGEDTVVEEIGIITGADMVNLRSTPEMTNNIVETLNKGTELIVLEKNNLWCKVTTFDGTNGFIRADLITIRG